MSEADWTPTVFLLVGIRVFNSVLEGEKRNTHKNNKTSELMLPSSSSVLDVNQPFEYNLI